MPRPSPIHALPIPVQSYLRAFARRRRAVLLLRGLGMSLAIAIIWGLAACLADRIVPLSAGVRRAMLAGGIGLAAAAGTRAVLRALRAVDWIATTGLIESRTDRFGQRLQTVISRTLGPADRRGSEAMLRATLDAVESLSRGVNGARLIPWRLAALPWIAAISVLSLAAMLWRMPAVNLPRLIARLSHPARRIEPVSLTRLDITPGDTEVSPGGLAVVTAEVSGAQLAAANARGVELFLSHDGKVWSRAVMNAVSVTDVASRFTLPLPSIDRDLRYYVRAGDERSEEFQISVKRVPAVAEFHIRYTYPEYTGRKAVQVTNTDGLIEALDGCEALMTIIATEPLAGAELTVGDRQLEMTQAGKPTEWEVAVSVRDNAVCSLALRSQAGVPGRGPSPMLLKVVPDKEPVVQIQQPAVDLRLSPGGAVTLHYLASDDFGINYLWVFVELNDGSPQALKLNAQAGSPRLEGGYTFALPAWQVKTGDVVALWLEAEDTEGQVRASEARRVLAAPISVTMEFYARAAELKRAARLAIAWKEALSKAREAVDPVRGKDPAKIKPDAWARANRALAAAGDAAALRQALLRALLRCDSPELGVALAGMIDETLIPPIEPGRVLSAAMRPDDAIFDRLAGRTRTADELIASINVLAAGEQGSLALAESENVRIVSALPPPRRSVQDIRARAVNRARQAMEMILRSAPGSQEQLRARVGQENELVRRRRPLDLVAAATEWAERLRRPYASGATYPLRLQAAAHVEALRPGGDLTLAEDLLLASRAAAKVAQTTATERDTQHARKKDSPNDKLYEPVTQCQRAIATLLRDRPHARPAREALARLAGDHESNEAAALEELIFKANAANLEMTLKLDADLTATIARSSLEESARLAEDLARLRADAADAHLDPRSAARLLALRRLEEVPALAPLFQPYAADEGAATSFAGGWPRYGTRFHEPLHTEPGDATRRESDPAGYAEQIKAYFDAINKTQQGRK